MTMTANERQTLRSTSICAYLATYGHKPVRTSGGKVLYHSPLRADSTASFWVNLDSNTFKDFGESRKPADIIELVQRLHGLDFPAACQHLANWSGSTQNQPFLFNGKTQTTKDETTIKAVLPLRNSTLIQYAASRGIPFVLAAQYLKEVHYTFKGRAYFSLGFANDAGGFALRNEAFKRCIEPNGITTLHITNSSGCNVFEGFFDFLSAIAIYGQPTRSTILLNSTSNITKALPALRKYQRLNVWLDNDPAGKKEVESLRAKGFFDLKDHSDIYAGFKDLNEYLCILKKP